MCAVTPHHPHVSRVAYHFGCLVIAPVPYFCLPPGFYQALVRRLQLSFHLASYGDIAVLAQEVLVVIFMSNKLEEIHSAGGRQIIVGVGNLPFFRYLFQRGFQFLDGLFGEKSKNILPEQRVLVVHVRVIFRFHDHVHARSVIFQKQQRVAGHIQ